MYLDNNVSCQLNNICKQYMYLYFSWRQIRIPLFVHFSVHNSSQQYLRQLEIIFKKFFIIASNDNFLNTSTD